MHISDGVLSAPALWSGAGLAVGGVWLGLRRLDYDRIPRVAVLSSAFFVASLAHVPLPGGASGHLVLNGLVGLILGWAAFPAILVGLLLQAILFQHGGFTVLGVNTVTMAAPAVLVHMALRRATRARSDRLAALAGFAAGVSGVLLASALVCVALIASHEALQEAATTLFVFHVPLMLVEGCVAASVVTFLRKTRPDLLEAPLVEKADAT